MIEEEPENFCENRRIGENESYICELIRNDSVEEFISFINKSNISHESIIPKSIYESNSFLLKKDKISLIEYAAFYGSIQIFNYLKFNNVKLDPLLWLYAIHGYNPEIIHILEEICEINDDKLIKELFLESIKCHHNDIAKYILNNYLKNDEMNLSVALKWYNFAFIQNEKIDEHAFLDLCKYDYYFLTYSVLKNKNIDIDEINIFRIIIKFQIILDKAALNLAIEKENIDIIKLLLTNEKFDINIIYI